MTGVRTSTAGLLAASWFAGVTLAQQPGPPPQAAVRDAPLRAGDAPAGRPPLPPLSDDAQRLIEQWKQNQGSIIDQLRFLQLTYRDAGRAEDAAAIAAQVRVMQQRLPPVSGTANADLVNEGLSSRDEPIVMSSFRNRPGETLSFAIRGRDDQPVWGTTAYSDVSGLETAAVHAGLLRAGQSGIIKVTPLPAQDRYDASSQNGVQSGTAGRSAGSYRVTSVTLTARTRTSTLSSYRDLVGYAITLPAVGASGGNVWGTDIYTDDSSVGGAAVHAGVLAVGEFAFVKVTLMPGQARYDGSPRNGVTSQSFEGFDGSFRVERALEPWIVQLPGGEDASRIVPMSTLRGRTGTSFVVQVVGSATGNVWGTGSYTDDSSIAAAAVHAGLLKPGEIGLVRVTIAEGRDAYAGSDRNGIKSASYAKYDGSYRLERAAR